MVYTSETMSGGNGASRGFLGRRLLRIKPTNGMLAFEGISWSTAPMIRQEQLFAMMEARPEMKAAFCKAIAATLDARGEDGSGFFARMRQKKKMVLLERFASGFAGDDRNASEEQREAIMQLVIDAANMWPDDGPLRPEMKAACCKAIAAILDARREDGSVFARMRQKKKMFEARFLLERFANRVRRGPQRFRGRARGHYAIGHRGRQYVAGRRPLEAPLASDPSKN